MTGNDGLNEKVTKVVGDPPREPHAEECCGTGCARCVWDVYYDKLEAYENKLEALTTKCKAGEVDIEDLLRDAAPKKSVPDAKHVGKNFNSGSSEAAAPTSNGTSSSQFTSPPVHSSSIFAPPVQRAPTAVTVRILMESELQGCTLETTEMFLAHHGFFSAATVSIESLTGSGCDASQDTTSSAIPSEPFATSQGKAESAGIRETGVGGAEEVFLSALQANIPCDTIAALPSPTPGSAMDVFAPNDSYMVAALLSRLRLHPDNICLFQESPIPAEQPFPSWLPRETPMTLRHFFTYYADISSSSALAPPLFKLLLDCTSSPIETSQLKAMLATPWGEFKQSLLPAYPSVLDVLDKFPKATPPLSRLVGVLGWLRARKFSLCAAPQQQQQLGSSVLSVLYNIGWKFVRAQRLQHYSCPISLVHNDTPTQARQFTGHVSKLLRTDGPNAPVPSQLFLRPPTAASVFALDAIPKTVFTVLLAAGTGITPFRYLIQERMAALMRHQEERQKVGGVTNSAMVRPLRLYYGCRTVPTMLFRSEYSSWVASGAVEAVSVSVSRETFLGRHTDLGAIMGHHHVRIGWQEHVTDALTQEMEAGTGIIAGQQRQQQELAEARSESANAVVENASAVRVVDDLVEAVHRGAAVVCACGPDGFMSSVRRVLGEALQKLTTESAGSSHQQSPPRQGEPLHGEPSGYQPSSGDSEIAKWEQDGKFIVDVWDIHNH